MRLLLLLALAACTPATSPTLDDTASRLPPPTQSLDLDVGAVLPGQTLTWTISGLNPGETAWLLWSTGLANPGPCPPVAGGLCLDIAGPPRVLRQLVANNGGVASWSATVPLNFAPGGITTFQAVALRGIGAVDSTKSRPVSRTTGTLPADQLQAGELVVTEIMKDPAAVADAVGEWVEVTNLSGVDVDLFGLTLSDDGGERFTVPASRTLPAGGRAVFGVNADPNLNGGVAVDVVWSGFSLDNTDDEVILDADGQEIDRVAYDDGLTFPDPSGASLSLSDDETDAVANDLGRAWCAGPASPGDDATPGAANPVCPSVCGDGDLDPGEGCDDGNLGPGDGCDGSCQPEPCGDGDLDPGEACDDGNLDAGDGCDPSCQVEVCPNPISRGEIQLDGRNNGYGAPVLVDVVRLPDGDLLWLGKVTLTGGVLGNRDAGYVVRVDGVTFQPEWAKLLSHSSSNYTLVGAAPAPNGDVWVVANGSWGLRQDDVFFARLSSAGALVSHRRVDAGVRERDFGLHVAPDPDGGFSVGGEWFDTSDQDDVFAMVFSVTPAGAIRWQKDGTGRPDATEHVAGLQRMRNGNLAVWAKLERFPFTDLTHVEMTDPNGARVFAGELAWDRPPASATELWNGDLLLGATDMQSTIGRLVAFNPASGTVRWTKSVRGANQEFYDPSVTLSPPLCDVTPVNGQVCADPGATCANAAGLVCACAGGAWACGPEQARIDVGWNLNGVLDGAAWTRHEPDGDLLSVRNLAGLLGTAAGPSWRRADGGYREVVSYAGTGWGRITALDTDDLRDAACGQTAPAGLSSPVGLATWVPTGLFVTRARYATSADTELQVDPLPLPTSTEPCHDEVCP